MMAVFVGDTVGLKPDAALKIGTEGYALYQVIDYHGDLVLIKEIGTSRWHSIWVERKACYKVGI